jgi:hypothetical protein
MLAAAVALGIGPDFGFADRAPSGWAADPAVAADGVLGALIAPESLLAAAAFAAAAAGLGWVLSARHASIALLGSMVWAALVASALNAVAGGAFGASALAVVAAAGLAVVVEFAVGRPGVPLRRRPDRRPESELAGATLSERLA